MNNRILKQYVDGESHSEEYDTLIPRRIEVLGCRSYADCTYVETVRFIFDIGNGKGSVPMPITKKIVELDIETGYLPDERVKGNLMGLLSRFKIFQLERLIEAFFYRKYYSPIF